MHALSGKPSPLLDTRTIFCGDNLDQLKKLPANSVDLIYIDPPFNSNRTYEVFWGETKEKRSFEDRHESTQAYIDFMRPRCVELARILKDTGSLYYHCDWHASHYIKVMLDQIFGENHFQNEIVWYYGPKATQNATRFQKKHDSIFFYSKSKKYKFNTILQEYSEGSLDERDTRYKHSDQDGQYRLTTRRNKQGERYRAKVYLRAGVAMTDVWTVGVINATSNERLGYPTQKPLTLLERIIRASSNENDIVLDAFCGCGTALVAAQTLGRQWIGIDISPTACRVMAKRLRDVCGLPENEKLWRVGRGFVVRALPWSEKQLRSIPPFEFENWAVIALGGIPNKAQVGDMGIDGRIYPVSSMPKVDELATRELQFMDTWYPIQVKQKDKAGRPDIDMFEAAMIREKRTKGFFVSFEFSADALREIDAFFRREHGVIVPLTVREILDESLAHKLA
jgi:DNA modification methylase